MALLAYLDYDAGSVGQRPERAVAMTGGAVRYKATERTPVSLRVIVELLGI